MQHSYFLLNGKWPGKKFLALDFLMGKYSLENVGGTFSFKRHDPTLLKMRSAGNSGE